jgi:hypothetical protein
MIRISSDASKNARWTAADAVATVGNCKMRLAGYIPCRDEMRCQVEFLPVLNIRRESVSGRNEISADS